MEDECLAFVGGFGGNNPLDAVLDFGEFFEGRFVLKIVRFGFLVVRIRVEALRLGIVERRRICKAFLLGFFPVILRLVAEPVVFQVIVIVAEFGKAFLLRGIVLSRRRKSILLRVRPVRNRQKPVSLEILVKLGRLYA